MSASTLLPVQLIAYAAGTGGSLLIIGSASGVALMGLEQQAKFG
jgi:Na+/H+ antiporter NhaD/arsenite permease-like protein